MATRTRDKIDLVLSADMKLSCKWKYVFSITCYILIFLTLLLIVIRFEDAGWDYYLYCSAIKAMEDGKNPYYTDNLMEYSGGGKLSFVYPPLSVLFLKAVCFFDTKMSYFILWAVLIILTYFVIRSAGSNLEPLFIAVLLITGFRSTYYNFRTGNVGLLELFFFSFVFLFLKKRKHIFSTIFLNLTAWLKVFPILFGGLFIFLRSSKRNKAKVLSFVLIGFVLLNALSYFAFPSVISSYYLALMGKIENPHNHLKEEGGARNPSAFLFFKQFSQRLFGPNNAIYLVFFILFIVVVFALFSRYAMNKERSFLEAFSLGVLAILLVLPRLKPYSFTLALIPILFLTRDFDYKNKFYTILLASLIPLTFHGLNRFLVYFPENFLWLSTQLQFLLSYTDLFCLFAIFLFIQIRFYSSSQLRKPIIVRI